MLSTLIILAVLFIGLNDRWINSYTVRKSKHRAWPWRFGLCLGENFAWTVRFDNSAFYRIEGEDQSDINKLVGVGYLPGIHKNSARFGWRAYDDSRVELFAYVYDNGKRSSESLGLLQMHRPYKLQLELTERCYYFFVEDGLTKQTAGMTGILKTHGQLLGLRLGLFFGGNKPAPHNITVSIKRTK